MPASSDSVKVAVRVRPFNQREKNAGSRCVIKMDGKTTSISHPDTGDTKNFSFDHSYWSHDGFMETADGILEPASPSSKYTDQRSVFSDLGQGVLDNAFQGYNAALFAYGQTGSGKSYSMIGYGPNKGIVPITCQELFQVIDNKAGDDKKQQSRVFFSMLEIYNEQVRDLLVKAKPPHGGLKIRQNPKMGFYVEGLKQVPVRNYEEIEKLMESGTINRTTASTNMNATSSRSHMVITIRFEQVIVSDTGQSNTRSSDINLVDLAGSERADSTGAVGDRLKEGSAINQSLSMLGNVISALADVAMGKKKVLVPYRDSVLTKLLQSALGGNSRTIMTVQKDEYMPNLFRARYLLRREFVVHAQSGSAFRDFCREVIAEIAALSPAHINYDETLSTLRYADRAKKIQNKAVINESPTDRLIRELKEENARLMAMLKKQGRGDTSGMEEFGGEGREDIQRMLEDNQKRMANMQMSWEQRLEEARKEWEKSHAHERREEEGGQWTSHPYITNVNEDPQLSGVIKHVLCRECTQIGRAGSGDGAISIRGLGIQQRHAELQTDGSSTFVQPCSESAVVILNGIKVREKALLRHMDRLKFGSASLFLYIGYPRERSRNDVTSDFNYDYFMTEMAEHEGVSVDISTPRLGEEEEEDTSRGVLFQEFVDLMPNIAEANAISEELKRFTKFEANIKSAASHDPKGTDPAKEVIVKVTNTKSKKVWVWSKSKFYNRKDLMDELYLKHVDGDSPPILTRDKDPFWDPVDDVFLGSCHILLQSITYGAEVDEHFTVHNYHGREEAVLQVLMALCDDKGQITHDDTVIDPHDLQGRPLNFIFAIPHCMSVRWISEDQSRGVECRFVLPFQKQCRTKPVWHKSYVEFEHRQHVRYKAMTRDMIDFFRDNALVLELWGKQVSEDEQLHQHSVLSTNGNSANHNGADILTQLKFKEAEVEKLSVEYEQLKKDNFRLKQGLMKAEDKIKLVEMRGNLKRNNSRERKASVSSDTAAAQQHGLDVEFAKTLREFFKEIKDVQNSLVDMYDFVSVTKEKPQINGIKKSLDDHGKKIETTNDKLAQALTKLKKGAAVSLRKGRPGTEK